MLQMIKVAGARKHGMFAIMAYTNSGENFIMKRKFRRDDPLTMKTIRRIREVGEINLEYWNKAQNKGWN